MKIHVYVVLTFIILRMPSIYNASTPQCNIIFHFNFELCQWGTNNSHSLATDVPTLQCAHEEICRREFHVAYIELQPYYRVRSVIQEMLDYCCGTCAHVTTINTFADISETNMDNLLTADFVYPFLAPTSAEEIHGFYFIPIFDAPSAIYITEKRQSAKETLLSLIYACAELWPLLVICLLMALISGFVAWILETWNNVEQFPRPFFIGLFEGFWWAFISMTTVGYGDKSPKCWPARIFSVFWILIGITICSMFTAALTTEITSAMTHDTPEIAGNEIGWFQGRLYEATIIAQHGGTLHTVQDDNYISGIKKLFKLIYSKRITGVVLDTYIFNMFKMNAVNTTSDTYDKDLHDMIINRTLYTEVFNKGDKLSFGVLVREKSINEYFRKYFLDNHLQMEACNSFSMNLVTEETKDDNMLFSVKAGIFWPFFAGTVGILAVICVFGVIFELIRMRSKGIAHKWKEELERTDGKIRKH